MRRYALSGVTILIFAALAAMALFGPQPLGLSGGPLGRVQGLIDTALVARIGRLGAGVAVMVLGLVLAVALRPKANPAGESLPARLKIAPRRKPDAEEAEADAEVQAAADRRMAALRERTLAPAETFAEPGPVLVLRRSRGPDGAGWRGARSWLGGLPRLGGQPWPMGRGSGLPLPFAAQIDLADLAAARPGSGLPDAGSLAFFLGEGAVVFVPPAPEGSRHPRFPQAPGGLAVRDGEEPFPADPSPDARGTWPWWRVDLLAMDQPANAEGEPAIPSRQGPLDAESLCRDCGIDPVPLWWHSVRHFAAGLRRARFHAQGDAEMLDTAIAALDWFAQDRVDEDILAPSERADFETMFAEIHQHCDDMVAQFVPDRPEDLASATLRAMASGPAQLHAALPPAIAERIDRDHRQPQGAVHRMFGAPSGEGLLLLQLASDDLMEWHFGDGGVFQFRISPQDLAQGWLDRAELAFYYV